MKETIWNMDTYKGKKHDDKKETSMVKEVIKIAIIVIAILWVAGFIQAAIEVPKEIYDYSLYFSNNPLTAIRRSGYIAYLDLCVLLM